MKTDENTLLTNERGESKNSNFNFLFKVYSSCYKL